MSTIGHALRKVRPRLRKGRESAVPIEGLGAVAQTPPVDIAPNDPIIAYFQGASGAVDIEDLDIDSPGLEELKAAGVKLVVPLVSQGELIGLLNLGPRLSAQDYSADDRKLLSNLAAQAAPAVRVGQLVREQEAEIRNRERLEQELRVAHLIQQQFLPKELPELGGWQVSAYYQAAREVGGDFYDFIELPEGKVGVVVGDVTDKGVPAALVMATTRSILRSDAPRLESPAKVLERANDLLVPDIPAQMFVTCLYGVLDPSTGRFRFANAGHNVPYVATEDGVAEVRATGMPLGLMPGMTYEEKEYKLRPGDAVLFHSDGVAEAHDAGGDMFGFPRLMKLVENARDDDVIDVVLTDLHGFTGAAWEQEDDITLVTLRRSEAVDRSSEDESRVLAEFTVPSELGNERMVMERVGEAVDDIDLSPDRLERLKTAVAEATMNAIEHGNKERAELPVHVRVLVSQSDLSVLIRDHGGDRVLPETETPDLDAKLAGLQSPRGWGLFLIRNMVDDVQTSSDGTYHTIELVLRLEGDDGEHDSV
jgi:serine phosphatase RsbU (regulator of sigma subunit)/anti-sigma regulatory factor (Ser/Thr protein kinase)